MANFFWAPERMWLTWQTRDDLNRLHEYALLVRNFLDSRANVPAPGDLTLDSEDDHADAEWQLHQERFGVLFQETLTASLLVTTDTYIETQLKRICDAIEKAKLDILVKRSDIKGESVIDQLRIFLKKVHGVSTFPDQSTEWSRVTTYHIVRNAITHADGRVASKKAMRKVQALQRFRPDFLEIEGDTVKPTFAGCLDFIKNGKDFIHKLLKNMSDWDSNPQIDPPAV